MAFKRTLAIHIDAPPEVVYDYVTDLTRHPEWADQKMEITVDSQPVAVGTTFTSTVRFVKAIPARGRVLEMQRPQTFVYECTDSSGTHRWTMRIQPDGTGSLLEQTIERIWVPFYIKVVQAGVMWPLFGRPQIRHGLANIKSRIEEAAIVTD